MVECSRMTISAFQEQVHKSYLDNLHFPLRCIRLGCLKTPFLGQIR